MDHVDDAVDPTELVISSQDHSPAIHDSFTVDKPSSESVSANPLSSPNADAFDIPELPISGSFTEPHNTINTHPLSTSAVPQAITTLGIESAEIEAVLDVTTNTEGASVTTVSGSFVVGENSANVMGTTAIDIVPAVDTTDYATTTEYQEGRSISESVTVPAEESLADKTLDDSAIVILPAVVEKEEGREDDGLVNNPDVEPATSGMSAVVEVDETIYKIQTDGSLVEEVPQVEGVVAAESECVVATGMESLSNDGVPISATEVLEDAAVATDHAPEEQPQQVGVAPEVPVAELNEPEDESGVTEGVEETAHVAAELNVVEANSHEAVEQPITEEVNENEATLERLDVQPEITAHTIGQLEESASEGVTGPAEAQAGVGEDDCSAVVEEDTPEAVESEPVTEAVVEEASVGAESVVENTSEATAVQAIAQEPVAEITYEEPAHAEPEATAKVVEEVVAVETKTAGEEAPTPVSAEAVAPAFTEVNIATEETAVPIKAEPIVEPASEGPPVVAEAPSVVEVANNQTATPVEAEETLLTASHPTTDVTSGEALTPINSGLTASETIPIKTEPSAEITGAVAPTIIAEVFLGTDQGISSPAGAEPIPETNEEALPAVDEETVPTKVEPAALATDEVLPVTAGATTSTGDEIDNTEASVSDAGVELVITAAIHEAGSAQTAEVETPLADVSSEAVLEGTRAFEIASEDILTEAISEPVVEVFVAAAVPCEDTVSSVKVEEIAAEGALSAVDPTASELPTEDGPGIVADDELETLVKSTLSQPEVSETSINDGAEVALEDVSIALATNSVEKTSYASVQEANAEAEQLAFTPAEIGHLSEPAEQRTEPVGDVADADPVTGQSLDVQTAPDTISSALGVDDGAEEQELHLLNIAKETEQPKSPWSPSFQVIPIGYPEEDTERAPIENESNAEKLNDIVVATAPIITEDEAAKQDLLTTASEDFADNQPLEPTGDPQNDSTPFAVPSRSVLTETNTKPGDVSLEEQQVADVTVPAEAVPSELQAEPEVSTTESEDSNGRIPETITVPQEPAELGNGNVDVASTDTTEASTEETVTTNDIALANEGMDKVSETSSHEEVSVGPFVDALDSSVKTRASSYSAHAQGTPMVLEEAITRAADTEPPKAETSPNLKEYLFRPQAALPTFGSVLDSSPNCREKSSKSTSSTSHTQSTPTSPRVDTGRVLIMCFDGTGNQFGENSNIVRLFRALQKGDHKRQVLYYQPGIGTYNKRAFVTHTVSTISSAIDFAIARHLDDHVKDGYKFVIQNYKPGDKVCLFGFSRGAHTARVVAGMIYKVGILPRENLQQVDFAFNIYMTTGYQGYKLSREFKSTFASHVDIDFVGVWDTVSSVGIIPQSHPYTSMNYSVKCFRHALALDERRSRFRPNVWGEQTIDREQELDVDLPIDWEVDQDNRDKWKYAPPARDQADVKEVWFAGSHSDVGGGSHPTRRNRSLSYVPLRWMIKECILARTGVQFDMNYLRDDLDFDFHDLVKEMKTKNMKTKDLGEAYRGIEKYAAESLTRAQVQENEELLKPSDAASSGTYRTHSQGIRRHLRDVLDVIFDQLLIMWWFWWLLELIPMLTTYQDIEGNWVRLRMRNLGRGRYIPFHNNKIYIHKTVELRLEQGYKPNARNWDIVSKSPMLEYVS